MLLGRSVSLDEELTTCRSSKGEKYLSHGQEADDSGPDKELIEEEDEE